MDPEVLHKLKSAITSRRSIELADFQWINLDMIKDEVGDQWISVRKKIYLVATQFIEKRIATGDVLIKCRGGFLLVYNDLDASQAEAKTAEIAEALNLFFLGDSILKHLEIDAHSRTVQADELVELVQRGRFEAAKDDGGERSQQPADPVSGRPAEGSGWKALERRGGQNEHVSVRSQASSSPMDDSLWKAEGAVLHPPEDIRPVDVVDATGSLDEVGSLPFKVPAPKWDDIIFKPCWDVKFNYITANFCLPRRRFQGQNLYAKQTLLGNDDPELIQAMDHAIAITAQRGFMKRLAAGHKCAVVIPVQYSTIQPHKDRVRYFTTLQNVPPRQRKYFYIRIDGIPEGVPLGQLEELCKSMRIFGSNILVKLPLGDVHLERFENCGVGIFCVSLENAVSMDGLSDKTVSKIVNQSVSIRRSASRAALTQVDSLTELTIGLDAGFEIFTGDSIGGDQGLPMPLTSCNLMDLQRRASDIIAEREESGQAREA